MMRKLCIFFFLSFSLMIFLPAQQVLVPKEVFVGDGAELHYSFQSEFDFFSRAEILDGEEDIISFSRFKDVVHAVPTEDCTIRSVSLRRIGITYTLIVSFVPWRPGEIDIEPFDLCALCSYRQEEDSFIIDLAPVSISSLSERTGTSSIRPPLAPLLLPGTSYVVWSLIIVLLLLLIAMGLVVAKFSTIMHHILSLRENLGYYRNASRTRRKLFFLKRKKCSDRQFAEHWQHIMRGYLTYRFHTSFDSVPSGTIFSVVSRVTGDILSFEQEDAVLSLASLFTRTDYIKFAAGSIDARQLPQEEYAAAFTSGERKNIIEMTYINIRDLECQQIV